MSDRPSNPRTSAARQLEGRFGLTLEQWENIIEIVATVLLSLAALATSWSGYQASLYNGEMSTLYNRAAVKRVEATRAVTLANQQIQVDLELFTSWLDAYASGNTRLVDFYQTRFEPEFARAFAVGSLRDPLNNPAAVRQPLRPARLRTAGPCRGRRLTQESEEMFERGNAAGAIGDNYVLNTVVLALVLFLGALEPRLNALSLRTVIIVMALLLLLYGLFNLLRYPLFINGG
ncbi:hypothetical protein HC891_02440 [Candidatus Gracilibacteria bacterium]|nr:hypothetical protein [Candidatus Gracilibacteria bacterium]